VASTFGVLGMRGAPQVRPQDPLHRQDQPQRADDLPQHVRPGDVRHRGAGLRHGRGGIGATIYFGSPESRRQITEIAEAFALAHELGMATVLWCYLRNNGFKKDGKDYHDRGRPHGQANHLGVTIQADIIKQKLPENNGGYNDPPSRATARPTRRSTASSPPTTPSTCAATRWPTATWAASA
jgi:class I fructose-bisphosphate aldolase